jgi:hypothetical protein
MLLGLADTTNPSGPVPADFRFFSRAFYGRSSVYVLRFVRLGLIVTDPFAPT